MDRNREAAPPPAGATLRVLREASLSCHACPLWRRATQTVFGEGPAPAALMLVGEQPGDEEDRCGLPFVGPAGRLLDRALTDAGIDRGDTYVTNAVKHFKWVSKPERGKRRLHEKPSTTEVNACRPWLLAEIESVAPKVIVCQIVPTMHPAAILRARDDEDRRRETLLLVADLRAAAALTHS